MALTDTVIKDMTAAMKAQDKETLAVIRMVKGIIWWRSNSCYKKTS